MEIFAQEFELASYFCDWTCVQLIMSLQNWPKFDFQSQLSMPKVCFLISIFVSVRIIRLEEQLIIQQFLYYLIFWSCLFSEIGPYFCRPKSNDINNKLVQILGQKFSFGGLCNFVRKKWGHANLGGTYPDKSTITLCLWTYPAIILFARIFNSFFENIVDFSWQFWMMKK